MLNFINNTDITARNELYTNINKPHVLVIEDNPYIQTCMDLMLKKLGCDVDIAANGTQALALFASHYDLVLLDIGLPDIDGFEVAACMREQEKNNGIHTPIIVT